MILEEGGLKRNHFLKEKTKIIGVVLQIEENKQNKT